MLQKTPNSNTKYHRVFNLTVTVKHKEEPHSCIIAHLHEGESYWSQCPWCSGQFSYTKSARLYKRQAVFIKRSQNRLDHRGYQRYGKGKFKCWWHLAGEARNTFETSLKLSWVHYYLYQNTLECIIALIAFYVKYNGAVFCFCDHMVLFVSPERVNKQHK